MNKRNFLKSLVALPFATFIGNRANAKPTNPIYDRMKLCHQYPGAYHEPHDLWTPDEITESGFVFVPFPVFIHKFDDPWHPIMKSYGSGAPNEQPIVVRTQRCIPYYLKTHDLYAYRVRGIESICDYYNKKEIFKPMISSWMKENKYHYIHRVSMGNNPIIWNETFEKSDKYFHMFPVFVRGSKLPKRI